MQNSKGIKGTAGATNLQQKAQNQTTQATVGAQQQELAPNAMQIESSSNVTVIDPSKLTGMIFADQYQLMEKLGSGAFGVIYKTKSLKEEDTFYGCKVERADTKHPQIIFEARLYNYLHNNPNRPALGIPKCYHFDKFGDYNFMIMDLLGKSLEQLFCQSGRQFSLKTVLMLADQMIQRVEYLHNRNFLHRDIKPDNFLMGTGKRETRVYMIDFGLAKRYIRDGEHIQYKDGKNLTGTARYASISTHIGIEQSRRDDLESLGYLPWQNIRAKDKKEKYEKIKIKKEATSVDDLCLGLPSEFSWFLSYSKSLKFTDKPDYNRCRQIFKDLMTKNDFNYDHQWDWKLKDVSNQTTSDGNGNDLLLMQKKNQPQNVNPIQNNNQNVRNSNNGSAIVNQNQIMLNPQQIQPQQKGISSSQMQQSPSHLQQQQQQQQKIMQNLIMDNNQNNLNNLNNLISSKEEITHQIFQRNQVKQPQFQQNLLQQKQIYQIGDLTPQENFQIQINNNQQYEQEEVQNKIIKDLLLEQQKQQQMYRLQKQDQNQKTHFQNYNINQSNNPNQLATNAQYYFDNNTSLFNYLNNAQYMQNQDSFMFLNGNNNIMNNGGYNNPQNGIQNILNTSSGMILTDAQQQQLIFQQQQYLETQNNVRNNINLKNSGNASINQLEQQLQINQTSSLAKQGNQVLNNNQTLNYYLQQQQMQNQNLLRSQNQFTNSQFVNQNISNLNILDNSTQQNNNQSSQINQQYMNYQQQPTQTSADVNMLNYINSTNNNQQYMGFNYHNNINVNILIGNNRNVSKDNKINNNNNSYNNIS